MDVDEVGPNESDCEIDLYHPPTNNRTRIPVKRTPKRIRVDSPDPDPTLTQSALVGKHATGVLCRSDGVPLKVTVSGWSEFPEHPLLDQLNNFDWTNNAYRMCDTTRIQHTLKPVPECDQGTRGRYMASHVEKQLLAYVFSTLTSNVTGVDGLRGGVDQRLQWKRGEDEMDWTQTFRDLFLEERVVVYVDEPVCADCRQCAVAFVAKTGVRVTMFGPGQRWDF